MSELDERLDAGRLMVATMGPPDDLWARVLERSNASDADVQDLTVAPQHRRRPSMWLAVAAVTVLLALLGALVLPDDQTLDTTPATEAPAVTDGPTKLATAEDVEIGDSGQTLNIDAMQQDGEVTGEFRIDDVVVTLECAGIETRGEELVPPADGRDLILGGVVTADPGGRGLVTGAGDATVHVGDRVALVIRQRGAGAKVVLYTDARAGSCTELVESVPFNLDGGFFHGGGVGEGIEIEPLSTTVARPKT